MDKQTKMHKIILVMKRIFYTYMFLLILFGAMGLFSKRIDFSFDRNNAKEWTEGWRVFVDYDEIGYRILPAKVDGVTDETVTIKKQLPAELGDYNCLLVEAKRQDVMVYVRNSLRRSFTSATLRQGRSLPNAYLIVPIDKEDGSGIVTITYHTDSIYSGNIGKVYIGDEISILMMLLKRNLIWLMLITVLLALFLFCLAFRYIYRRSFDRVNLYGYLSVFCLCSSVYCVNQLQIKQCFIGDLPMLEGFAYGAFMLIPFAILMISYGVSGFKHKIAIIVLGAISLINFITQQLHHSIRNVDYFSMQSYTQFIIVAVLITMIVLHLRDKDKGLINDTYFVVASCSYLLSGIILEAIIQTLNTNIPVGSIYLIFSFVYAITVLSYIFISLSKEQERKKNAELANQAKSAFLASMSHEIRTPINAIVGINEIISRETKEETTRQYASNIAEASSSLLYLVNDILDYSKIEAGKMDIVDVEYEPQKIIDELTILAEARLQDKNLEFKLDVDQNLPSVLLGDSARIKQVCINLLTNAIKYTEKGSFTFTVKCQEISDSDVILYVSVKDTGIGIKDEDRDKIMGKAFVRLDEKKNYNIEGTGLGLSITTRLLELMNSKLELDSVYGEGSDFHFVIVQKIIDKTPIQKKVQKTKTETKALAFKCPKANILVVDDTKTNIVVMKGLLKQYGNDAQTCISGEECIEKCKENKYDVIFLDHMMPGLDGIETLERLREENLIGDTPVVALTANAISGAKEMYLEHGFNEYMSKPFKMIELEEMLRKTLNSELIENVETEDNGIQN